MPGLTWHSGPSSHLSKKEKLMEVVMSRLWSRRLLYWVLSLVFLPVACPTLAGLPEPMDPRLAMTLSFEKRLEYYAALRHAMAQASPQERRAYREALRQKMAALSLGQRQLIHDQLHAEWRALSQAQKEQVKQERKALMKQLSREEKKEIRETQRRRFSTDHPL